MIYTFSTACSLLIKYDIEACKTYVASSSGNNEEHYFVASSNDETGRRCPYTEMLYKERLLTSYGEVGRQNAINKVRVGANKFGRFSDAKEFVCNQDLSSLGLCVEDLLMIKKISSVFENKGKTDWQFEGVGRGALRIYPSNGAIHSFRPRIVLEKYIFDFFPSSKTLVVQLNEKEHVVNYLYVICEMDRVLEKYSDVGTLAALYLELGHLVSALLFFAELTIGSILLTAFQEEDHQATVFARLAI